MSSKKVSDMIIDKLSENIGADSLFENISKEIANMIKERKHSKEAIEELLKRRKNEDTGT